MEGAERHLCTLKDLNVVPNVRDFGIQDQNDLIDMQHLQSLEKMLPVINGLLFLKKENRTAVITDGPYLKTLFDIFKFQIPVELHENAMYACLNILQDCPKQVKQQLNQLNIINPLLKFIKDLFEIEVDILQHRDGKFIVFADYKIEWNPEFSNSKLQAVANSRERELTLAEMQQERLQHQLYVWKDEEDALFRVAVDNPFNHSKVAGKESIKKNDLVQHLQSLRAIGYSLINLVQVANAQLLKEILATKYKELGKHLRADIVAGIKAAKEDDDEYHDDLFHETLELMLNIVGIKELYAYCDQSQLNLNFLESLLSFCQSNDEALQDRFGYESTQSRKLVTHKLIQAINDRKGKN